MTIIRLTTAQKVVASVNPILPIDGLPEWGIVEGAGTVESADDGMSAELVAPDAPGVTTYMVTADRNTDVPVTELSELIVMIAVEPAQMGLGLAVIEQGCKCPP